MKSFEVKVEKRAEVGKKDTKKLRKEGKVPCVLYGGEEVIHFSAEEGDLRNLIYTPNSYIVKLLFGDKTIDAVVQDMQFHPISDRVLHIDFVEVFEDKKAIIKVPVRLTGFSKGVKEGGKLRQDLRKLKIKALPKDLPDFLEVDITDIGIDESIIVRDLNFENLEILDAKTNVVVIVLSTRAAAMAEEEEEAEEGAEAQPEAEKTEA